MILRRTFETSQRSASPHWSTCHHLPSSLQSISPSSSNWTWWTWGRATNRWVMLKPQAEVRLRQGSWEPDLGLWNSRHQLYAIPWIRRDCGTAQRGHIVPHHSKCLPRWFHNTFWRMESLPADTEWTWVWTSHGQLIKRMNGCHRDFLHWYLQEFMYRERFNEGNFFLNFVEHISLFYRV